MSTIVEPQPRQAAGSSTGGQYAAKETSTPGGTLAHGGTFMFPPRFETAEQMGKFFHEAEISDRIMSNAKHAYTAWWYEQREAYREKHAGAFDADPANQRWMQKASTTEYNFKVAEVLQTADEEARQNLPSFEITPDTFRTILISRQITYNRGSLINETEEQAALDYPVQMRGEYYTAKAIVDHFRPNSWAPRALTETDLPAVDAMTRVAKALEEKNDN